MGVPRESRRDQLGRRFAVKVMHAPVEITEPKNSAPAGVDSISRDEIGTRPDGDIIQFLDVLEDRIVNCTRVPFAQRILVDFEEFADLLGQVRQVSQGSSRQARSIVRLREKLLEEARQQATEMVDEAEQRARALISDEGVQEVAARESERLLEEAVARASKVRGDADAYAVDVLQSLRERLARTRSALVGES